MLLLLLAALGPHAADALAHANDPEAGWVREPPGILYKTHEMTAAPAVTRRVYGYLPYWESIDLAGYRWDLITDVIAFSADIATDGSVGNTHALPGSALVAAAHAHGVKVHLCATLFNSSGGSEIATFLASAAARAKAVQQLVALEGGIDGLNLDFEFVPPASKAQFTSFVQQLHAAMPGGELTLAMPSSTAYTGYDAAALAGSTERLLLMEYDYHWVTAPVSGANAPLTPVETAVGTFLAVAPAGRLAMGVPYYGYDWPTATSSAGASTTGGGTTVLFESVFDKFAAWGRIWDASSQTPWYRYSLSAQNHQGWVDDDQSLALKYAFVNQKNLAGIMIWALGYDGSRTESWDAIAAAFTSPPPPSTPGELRIVSVAYTGTVTATMRVKNVGGSTVAVTAPPPSTVYDEPQSSTGSIAGTWRVALEVKDRPAAQQAHPWRWGLAEPLDPGAEADLQVQVTLERSGTRTISAAVIHEGVDVPQDGVAPTQIVVGGGPPEVVDAGAPDRDGGGGPPEAPVRGCAQAGGAPWLALLALAPALRGARARRRLRNRRSRV